MDYEHLVDSLSPDMVARLRSAVETGRWPDGRALTSRQKEDSLQAVIAWEQRHLPEEQRTGYIDRDAVQRAHGSRGRGTEGADGATLITLRWTDDTGEGR